MHQRKWGSSLSIKKNKWIHNSNNDNFNNYADTNDNTEIKIALYLKSNKYHPFISFSNKFFENDENNNQEILTVGGMVKNSRYIMHWGWDIILIDDFKLHKDKASFFIGAGYEFF